MPTSKVTLDCKLSYKLPKYMEIISLLGAEGQKDY